MNLPSGILGTVVAASFAISGLVAAQEAEAEQEAPQVDEEIVVEGQRKLPPKVGKGFEAFAAGDFKAAVRYFHSIRRDEFRRKADNFTDWLNMAPNTIRGNGRMSGKHLDIRTSDPWRRQAYAILYYMEGMSKWAQGETEGAAISFRKALEMNPRHFDARAEFALVQIQLGEPKKAEKHIRRLAKDFRKCDAAEDEELCSVLRERLGQVEIAYGDAVSG